MGFQERKDENLEQRKETAEKRKLLLDNYERNKTIPRSQEKPPVQTMASVINTLGSSANKPAEVTLMVGGRESIGSEACGTHVSPTITKRDKSTSPSMVEKDEQPPAVSLKVTAAEVPTESPDILDSSAGGDRKSPSGEVRSHHVREHTNPNSRDVSSPSYLHPEMVFITSCPFTSETIATKFEIQKGNIVEVLDKIGRELWDEAVGLFSDLSAPSKTEWLVRAMCCLEEDTNTDFLYGDETHCLIEFRDLGARYSFQFYKGIYTWYVKFLDIDYHPDPRHQWSDFPQELFLPAQRILHPFYRNKLIPRTHLDFVNCETLAKRHWELQHEDCQQGHFRVNIYVNERRFESPYVMSTVSGKHTVDGENLQGSFAKFTSHRVCGHALVADLFCAMRGSVDGREAGKPQNWQCLREVMWHKQTKPTKTPTLELGRSYVYGALRHEVVRTKMVDTDWFTGGRDYVWLLPIEQDFHETDTFSLKAWFKQEG